MRLVMATHLTFRRYHPDSRFFEQDLQLVMHDYWKSLSSGSLLQYIFLLSPLPTCRHLRLPSIPLRSSSICKDWRTIIALLSVDHYVTLKRSWSGYSAIGSIRCLYALSPKNLEEHIITLVTHSSTPSQGSLHYFIGDSEILQSIQKLPKMEASTWKCLSSLPVRKWTLYKYHYIPKENDDFIYRMDDEL